MTVSQISFTEISSIVIENVAVTIYCKISNIWNKHVKMVTYPSVQGLTLQASAVSVSHTRTEIIYIYIQFIYILCIQ